MYFEKILFGLILLSLSVILFCRFARPDIALRKEEPWYLDWSRSFFPVLLLVFLLRGFVAEPFRIPSTSMLPTLEVGDFILVNKFTYGVRLPIVYKKVVELNEPERGDIVVFRYPGDNKTSYIKRLIGLPGDDIQVQGRNIFVNGVRVFAEPGDNYTSAVGARHESQTQYLPRTKDYAQFSAIYSRPARFSKRNYSVKVPEGQYFMMGDNRDNSSDSRVWGTVPEGNIVGKAFFVWMHYDPREDGGFDFSRVGTNIKPKTVTNRAARSQESFSSSQAERVTGN